MSPYAEKVLVALALITAWMVFQDRPLVSKALTSPVSMESRLQANHNVGMLTSYR